MIIMTGADADVMSWYGLWDTRSEFEIYLQVMSIDS